MPRQELLRELELREKELMEELEAIRLLLGSNKIESKALNNSNNEHTTKVIAAEGRSKDNMNWSDYILVVLRDIGGKGKSKEVTEAIIKANPNIEPNTIRHAVRHHLSRLFRDKVIDAKKSDVLSEGYEFYIKQ